MIKKVRAPSIFSETNNISFLSKFVFAQLRIVRSVCWVGVWLGELLRKLENRRKNHKTMPKSANPPRIDLGESNLFNVFLLIRELFKGSFPNCGVPLEECHQNNIWGELGRAGALGRWGCLHQSLAPLLSGRGCALKQSQIRQICLGIQGIILKNA